MRVTFLECKMCGLHFPTYRSDAKTCSPRCRKRRERCSKGKLPGTRLKFGIPPSVTASKMWR